MINDVQVLVLSPEDLILHLCLHTTRHIMKIGPKPFCDLSEVIRHYQVGVDWEQVQLRSREWKMDRPFFLMFHLLKELSGKAVPEDMLIILKSNPIDKHLLGEFKEHIFEYNIREVNSSSVLILHFTQFWKSEGLRGKAAFFLKNAFPSRKYIAQIYHIRSDSGRVYFYYLVRLKDLILRYRHILWRVCRSDKEITSLIKLDSRQIALKGWLVSR